MVAEGAWLLRVCGCRGHVWLLGGMCGCRVVCMAVGVVCMVAGGHVCLQGGVHSFWGGMHGCQGVHGLGACMVAGRHVWLLGGHA